MKIVKKNVYSTFSMQRNDSCTIDECPTKINLSLQRRVVRFNFQTNNHYLLIVIYQWKTKVFDEEIMKTVVSEALTRGIIII